MMRLAAHRLGARIIAVLLPATVLLSSAGMAQACDPAPPESMIRNSLYLLHARAVEVSRDRRAATVAVVAYVGPGEAPASIDLPRLTQMGSDCDQMFSGTFQQGADYLILFRKTPSDITSISADARIVLGVQAGMVGLDYGGDRKEPVESVVATFARTHGVPVKKPGPGAPTSWGIRAAATWLWLTGAAGVLALGGFYIWRRRHS